MKIGRQRSNIDLEEMVELPIQKVYHSISETAATELLYSADLILLCLYVLQYNIPISVHVLTCAKGKIKLGPSKSQMCNCVSLTISQQQLPQDN